MSDNHTNLNEILYKQDARLRLAMTLIPQRDQKASLELRICSRAYTVNYICNPKAVFRDFFDQQKNLIQNGVQDSICIRFFANHRREWILHVARHENTIELSLNKVLNWHRLVNKFKASCNIREYRNALYTFLQNLPGQTKKKGGIENS